MCDVPGECKCNGIIVTTKPGEDGKLLKTMLVSQLEKVHTCAVTRQLGGDDSKETQDLAQSAARWLALAEYARCAAE